jgi:hypothetical protein
MSSELNNEIIYNNFPRVPQQYNLNVINQNDILTNNISQQTDITLLQMPEPEEQLPEEINSKEFIKGQFLYVKDDNSREMLVNAWKAISLLNLWEYMTEFNYSYMMSDSSQVSLISKKMVELGYNGHSGFSFGWTLRQMQYIARYGEHKYFTLW